MNPWLPKREPLDHAAIEATWRKTQTTLTEYHLHPIVACIQPDCDELSKTPRRNNCPAHARANKQAVERMRLRRRRSAA